MIYSRSWDFLCIEVYLFGPMALNFCFGLRNARVRDCSRILILQPQILRKLLQPELLALQVRKLTSQRRNA